MTNYEEALKIIKTSLKTGRPLFEFKRWDFLDYAARQRALINSKCAGCFKVKRITGTITHLYGTEGACKDCSDQTNYPHLFKDETTKMRYL